MKNNVIQFEPNRIHDRGPGSPHAKAESMAEIVRPFPDTVLWHTGTARDARDTAQGDRRWHDRRGHGAAPDTAQGDRRWHDRRGAIAPGAVPGETLAEYIESFFPTNKES